MSGPSSLLRRETSDARPSPLPALPRPKSRFRDFESSMLNSGTPELSGGGEGGAVARERKFAAGELDVAADGTFSGYASLFGEADLSRDMVMPGAFLGSLGKRGAAGIRMLFQHDPAAPIGVWQEVREDARGLFVRGRLTTEVARAREVLALMRAGAIDGLSIGFRTVRGRTDAKTGVRRLLEVDLWEISVVTFPMLPAARISAVKAVGGALLAAAIRRAARAMRT